jgi:hypothetical protein
MNVRRHDRGPWSSRSFARLATRLIITLVSARNTVTADGTVVPVAERAYLSCTMPRTHKCD